MKITKYLIYATIFLLPIYLVRFSIFGIPTNALEALIFITAISFFLKPRRYDFLEPRSRKKILLCISLIFAGLLLSILINKNYAVGAGIIKSWFVLPLVFSFMAVASIPEEKRKNIFQAYYFSTLAVAVISLAYYFFGAVTFDGRLQGIFNSPNYLAMYLAPGLIFSIWYIVFGTERDKQKKKRFFVGLGLALILIPFYLTLSYAAWTAVILSLAGAYFIKNKKISARLIVATALILLAVLASQQNTEKLNNFEKYSRSSLESRIMIWKSAGKILKDNIILGIGPGNFQNKYLEYQKYFPPYLEWAVPHPHNLYLAWWLYGGILSFAGFLSLMFFWFREMLAKEKNSLWAISFTIVFYFLLHGLADTTYFKNDLAVVFWLFLWLPIIPAGKVFRQCD
jgi:O-antigen ligase